MATGFSFLAAYGNTAARYSLIVILSIIAFVYSRTISDFGMKLIDIKKAG